MLTAPPTPDTAERTFLEARLAEVLRLAGARDDESSRALVAELWGHRRGDGALPLAELPAAASFGARGAESGDPSAEVVRRTLAIGRALETVAANFLDGAARTRLAALVDEAAARAAAGHDQLHHERRESWLAYLSHELKNPLNTILNALWLLREHRASPQAPRFLELAERAVRKLEAQIAEVRALHRNAAAPPPAKNAPRPQQS